MTNEIFKAIENKIKEHEIQINEHERQIEIIMSAIDALRAVLIYIENIETN